MLRCSVVVCLVFLLILIDAMYGGVFLPYMISAKSDIKPIIAIVSIPFVMMLNGKYVSMLVNANQTSKIKQNKE